MKRMIALGMVLLLCLTAMFGCAQTPTTTTGSTTGSNVSTTASQTSTTDSNLTAPGTFPIVNEKVTLTVFTHPTPELKVDSYDAKDDNAFSIWYEEKTNVTLDFQMAPSANEITQSLSLLFSSNQIPDIMLSNGFSSAQQLQYGNQGILLELSDLVASNAPRIQDMWDKNPAIKDAVTLSDEKIYAINFMNDDPHGATWNKMWVYKPWLEKLALAVPTTTEDFYNVLVAFRDHDPNGNGKKDEIPLIGNISWVAWDPTVYLMNAFIYNDYLNNVHVDNGKLFAAYVQPAYKEGLKWIAKLYHEGLISPETFTLNDMGAYKTIANQETNIIGFMPSHAPFAATEIHWPDFTPVPPLTGPAGVKTSMKNYIIPSTGAVISADSKNPEVAIRVLDGLFDVDVHLRAFIGREGKEWAVADADMVNKDGEPAKYQKLTTGSIYDPENGERNIIWPMALYFLDYVTVDWRNLWAVNPDDVDLVAPLEKATVELYIPTFPSDDTLLPVNMVYTDAQSTEISDLQALMDETTRTYRMKFILGEADIDAEWDSYIAELEADGLARYLEIMQAAYDAMK